MYLWTNEEIETILIQLDEKQGLFKKYSFTKKNEKLQLLGQGGFALVYEAESATDSRRKYAIKVIGFGEKHVDSKIFQKAAEAQKRIGFLEETIVKVYDYTERFLWIDEDNNVIQVQKREEETWEGNCLKLQFILMEKLQPVLRQEKANKIKLIPDCLARGEEKEILKLAYDIGKALSLAHKQNILHRDIKLENVFYAEKGKHYRLGDFGIARVTEDGMASTAAFTKGYGAPEVIGGLEEKYDNTADIYSFGMLLYVLLNDLKFPDSDTYNVNSKMQYQKGYVLPRPGREADGLWPIIEKMCRYDPDERYQSMDEVLDELEKLIFSSNTHYQREHKAAVLAVGTLFFYLGVIAWKLTFQLELVIQLSKMTYLFLALSVGKWILKLLKKDVKWISMVLFGIGLSIMVSSGFSWVNLALLLGITFSSGGFAGLSAGAILTVNAVCLMTQQNRQIWSGYQDYRWAAVTLLSLAAVMTARYYVLGERDYALTSIYLKKDRYWILVILTYASFVVYGIWTNGKTADMCSGFFGERLTGELLTYDLEKVGAIGLGVSIAWMVREKFLNHIRERSESPKNHSLLTKINNISAGQRVTHAKGSRKKT